MFASRYFCEREVELEEADVAIVLHFAEHGVIIRSSARLGY